MKAIFLRIIEIEDKGAALHEVITNQESPLRFEVAPESFAAVPRSPFAYWVSDSMRLLFRALMPLEGDGRVARRTNGTTDDSRWIRTTWEVQPAQVSQSAQWVLHVKGGAFSPYYADPHLVIAWDANRATYPGYLGTVHRPDIRPASMQYFFRPGLTWPRRTNGLSFRCMPAGCIFGDKGPGVFVEGDAPKDLLALCAVMNSAAFGALVALQLARTELAQSYEAGLIQQTPIPKLDASAREHLASLARRAWSLKRFLDTRNETSHAFVLPALLQVEGAVLAERASAWASRVGSVEAKLSEIQREINDLCFVLYGIDGSDRRQIEGGFGGVGEASDEVEAEAEDDVEANEIDATPLVASLVSWCVGVGFGVFDARLATDEDQPAGAPGPFDLLPSCSVGMLSGDDGQRAAEPPRGYPLEFPGHGILVDDPGFNGAHPHQADIVRRVREVLDLLWKDKAHRVEQEACEILGVKELRDYFRRPAGFFQDHLRRYSKSRRKAPIYWPLSTASGFYTIWLYYHRLTDQTLYAAVNKYVEPKIADVERAIGRIEKELEAASGREATQLRDRFNEGRTLAAELRDLRQELLRMAALPYRPNLNDGVIINAAPFHRLFGLRSWAKDAEKVWKKLEKGDYDWAHLAYTLWPDRVKEVCRGDRSIAIAHGLEDLCEVEAPPPKRRGRKQGRKKKEVGR